METSTGFGRSWNFEFLKITKKGTALAVPHKFTLTFKKDIDPLSGMTVNLVEVDAWWNKTSFIRQRKWADEFDFLEAAKTLLLPDWQQAQIQNWEISVADIDNNSWTLNQNLRLWTYSLTFFEKTGEIKKFRRALMTSKEQLEAGTLQKLQVLIADSIPQEWNQVFKDFSQLTNIKLLNFFNSSIDQEINL